MANELVHGTVGVGMTQAEFEAVGLHVLNSQATGDLIYASSATQLSRLGIGATNTILTVIGGVPTWQTTLAGLTLTAPTINGTVATTGLTLPAITLGGSVTGGAQTILNTGIIRINSATGYGGVTQPFEVNKVAAHGGIALNSWSVDSYTSLLEFNNAKNDTPGTYTARATGTILGYINFRSADGTDWQSAVSIRGYITGTVGDNRIPGELRVYIGSDIAASADILALNLKADSLAFATSNAAQTAAVTRLTIGGAAATATVTWASVNHDFGAGTITTGGSACVASFGPAGVASITVKNGLITAIS